MAPQRLIVFTRFPIAGQVKTRLIPVLGSEGAARLQRRLTLRAVRTAEELGAKLGAEIEIHFHGATEDAVRHWLGDGFVFRAQAPGDLGERMRWSFEKSFSEGSQAVVIIGSDCPGLTARVLEEAFARLRDSPVVLGPAHDGGYYLIGLAQRVPQLLSGISWGTGAVLTESLRILEGLGLKPALLRPLGDVDRPEDLAGWRKIVECEETGECEVSVIIPALNEADSIAATIAAAREGSPREVIVVDGHSNDRTVAHAREAGARVMVSAPGRARQMNAGAVRAGGNALLFVHADTLLPRGFVSVIGRQLREPGVAAGAFRLAVGGAFPGRRLLEWTTNWRSRRLQMPYGDQGLFVRRASFEELGGFADLPILEDYELVRRLRGCGRIVTVPEAAVTSGRRWRRLGFWRATLINQRVLLGYHFGRPLEELAALYRGAQARRRAVGDSK